jgi:CHAT domain-containing protein/tetratricopeptide (TPR) repeat protein
MIINNATRRIVLLFVLLPIFSIAQNNSTITDTNLYKTYLKKGNLLVNEIKYDSAIYFYNKVSEYAEKHSLSNLYFNSLLKKCHILRISLRTNQAQECLNEIINYSKENITYNKTLYAEYLHEKGSIIGRQGKYREAIRVLETLLKYRNSSKNKLDTLTAKTYHNIASFHYYLGEYHQAMKYFNKALEMDLLKKGDISYDLATDLQGIGSCLFQMRDYDAALNYYKKALTTAGKNFNIINPKFSRLYICLGMCYSYFGDYKTALSYYEIAKNIYIDRFGKNYVNLGIIYLNLGIIYKKESNYYDAELCYNKALAIYNCNIYSNKSELSSLYGNLGVLYIQKKSYKTALSFLKKNIELEITTDKTPLCLQNIACAYRYFKKPDLANSYYQKGINYCINKLPKDHIRLGNIYFSYGLFLYSIKNKNLAYNYYLKALDIYHKKLKPKSIKIASVYHELSFYHLNETNIKIALNYCQKALISNNRTFNDTNLNSNPDFKNTISLSQYLYIMLIKAKVCAIQYNQNIKDTISAKNCINCFDLAMNAFKNLKTNIEYEDKLRLTNNTKPRLDQIFECLFNRYVQSKQLYFLQKFFDYTEKVKANVLLSSIREQEAIKFSGIPDSIQTFENETKNRLNAYKNLVYEETKKQKPDSAKIDLWNQKLFDLSQQYDSIIEQMEKNFPNYYNLKHNHDVASIEEVKRYLSDDQLLIDYVLTDTALFTIAIEKYKEVIFSKHTIDSIFHQDLKTLQKLKSINFNGNCLKICKEFINASNRLYNILFSGIKERIKNKRLIIVPSGKLGYLSFESLVIKLPTIDKLNYKNLDYLLKSNPISYSYSASILVKETKKKKKPTKTLLAVAPEYKQESINKIIATVRDSSFAPLEYAKKEVNEISRFFKGDILSGFDASEKIFKKSAPDYNIIHLAMHAKIDNEEPMHSKMVFSQNNDSIDDGYLNTYEIYGMDLNADMVVLSACNTGTGKINKGEGIMSLARGFIYAGVPSIVMTLWKVDDKSGADIMTLFYKKLNKGISKDVALQQAKLEYLESASQLRSHPYFWASYVDVGNTKPLRNPFLARYGKYLYILIFILLILVVRKWYFV